MKQFLRDAKKLMYQFKNEKCCNNTQTTKSSKTRVSLHGMHGYQNPEQQNPIDFFYLVIQKNVVF